jgi:outer membrane autotransporter protein
MATNLRGVIGVFTFAGVLSLAISGAAMASTACDQVNAGGFDFSTTAPEGRGYFNFAVGEVLNFVGSGGTNSDVFYSQTFTAVNLIPQTPINGMNVSYTVTGNGDTNIQAWVNTSNPITVTATCSPAPPEPGPSPSGKDASQAVTKGFLLSRINGILLNDPGSTSLLNRSNTTLPGGIASAANGATNVASSGGVFGGAMGLGAGLANRRGDRIAIGASRFDDADPASDGSRNIQFSNSLSKMRREAAQAQMSKDRMALGAGDGGGLPLAYATAAPWDIWVEGRYSAFDDDAANLGRDGHVGVLYVGGDYRVADNVIAGVLAQFDWAKDDSGVLASKVDGNGWMIGPYMSAQVHENIFFDLRAAWGRSNNDLTLGTTTGGFDTSRWLVKGALAGNWVSDAWRFTPSAELAYVEESQDAFTNSAGTFVPGQDVSLGRLQFGPEFGYRFAHTADTFIEPFAAIKGVWDFDNPNVAIIDGFVVGPGDFWGRLEGGLNVMTAGGTYVRGWASWDGVGASDYSGYTLQGTVNVPLN